jgi:hypothetical protein
MLDLAILEMLKETKSPVAEQTSQDEEHLFGMQIAVKMRKLSDHRELLQN